MHAILECGPFTWRLSGNEIVLAYLSIYHSQSLSHPSTGPQSVTSTSDNQYLRGTMARYIISTNKLIRRYCGNYQRQARLLVTEANNNDRTTANVVLIGAGWWSQVSAFFILTCKDVVGFNIIVC